MRRLDGAWVSGKYLCTHAGFAVFTLGALNKPSKRASSIFQSADLAFDALESLTDKFGVFRVFNRDGHEFAREQIRLSDLPVEILKHGQVVDDRLRRPRRFNLFSSRGKEKSSD